MTLQFLRRTIPLVAALLALVPGILKAATLTTTNANLPNIVVPVFDTNLGTLNRVDLQVDFLPGSTIVFGHNHVIPPSIIEITSTNARSNTAVDPVPDFDILTPVYEFQEETVSTSTYAGGGLNLGEFSVNLTNGGPHQHTVRFRNGGFLQFGATAWAARYRVTDVRSGSYPEPVHNGATKTFAYFGADLAPFLQVNDIIIDGQSQSFQANQHSYFIDGFSVTVGTTAPPSLWSWSFLPFSLPSAADELRFIGVSFTTTAVFHYDPVVPEQTTLAYLIVGPLVALGRSRRFTSSCE